MAHINQWDYFEKNIQKKKKTPTFPVNNYCPVDVTLLSQGRPGSQDSPGLFSLYCS